MEQHRFEIFSTSVAQLIKSLHAIKSYKMAQYDLKGTTCLCLCQILSADGGLTAGELAERGSIDKAQVSRCMSELTGKGFAYREDADGRRYKQKYVLTESGRAAAKDIVATTEHIQSVAEQGISEAALETFYRVLDQMCENFGDITAQLAEK